MSGFENWPAPILRRWLLSAAAGPVIFLIGLAGRIALHDPTLLTLSTLLASCMVVRCILLFQAIRHGDYETVEGVCVARPSQTLGIPFFRRQIRQFLFNGEENIAVRPLSSGAPRRA